MIRPPSLVASLPHCLLVCSSFLFGTMVGSFLNVCIHRLPARQSLVRPRSRCPRCEAQIAAYDNIPLLSYPLLRGRCRNCGIRIPLRYPLVEAATGLLAVAALAHYGAGIQALIGFAFLCALLVVTFIDLDHQIIPDSVSLPGIVVGFAASFLPGEPSWVDSLVGLLLGGGILWAVAEAYYRFTGREGMGGGDVKLLAMIGAFLGWQAVFVTLILASFTGTLIGLALILVGGRNARVPIPFGPFLAAGAASATFFGPALVRWYLHLTLR